MYSRCNTTYMYIVHVFKWEMRRKKERSKQGQTNKQGTATQHVHTSHRSLFWCVEQPPSIERVGDVERVVLGCVAGVISSVHDEGVGLATLHHQLRNESVVNVPRNAPPS